MKRSGTGWGWLNRIQAGRREGQSLLLFAVMLPVLVVFVAFVVDGAHAFVDYRHLQNTADASALAAAQDIGSPSCTGPTLKCVQYQATDYAYQNGEWPVAHGVGQDMPLCGSTGVQPPNGNPSSDVEGCFEWPYNGDSGKVLVKLRDCTATLIGKFIGIDKICASVRSVALATPQTSTTVVPPQTIPGSTIYNTSTTTTVVNGTTSTVTSVSTTTIPGTTTTGPATTVTGVSTVQVPGGGVGFAMSTDCPAITYLGAGGGQISGLETNGGVRVGNNGIVTNLEWGKKGQPGCDQINSGGQVINGTLLTPGPVGWPIPIPTPPSSPPTAPNTCTSLGNASTTFTVAGHPKDVYCLGGSGTTLTISTSADYSGYTFVAPNITVSAGSSTFSPAAGENVVFNSTANGLNITKSTNTISGMMCLGSASVTMQMVAGHPKGAYCLLGATATLSLNSADWTGYSFYAPSISVSSNSGFYCPTSSTTSGGVETCNNSSATLFDAYAGGLTLQGQSNTASGNMFAPNGDADIQGGGVGAGYGYIEAQHITFHGNFASFHGTGGGGGGTVTTTTTIPGTTGTGPATTITNTSTSTTVVGATTSTSTSVSSTTTPDTTIPGSTVTSTTGTNIGLNE